MAKEYKGLKYGKKGRYYIVEILDQDGK